MQALCEAGGSAGWLPALAFIATVLTILTAERLGRWLDSASVERGNAAPFGAADKVRFASPALSALAVALIFSGALAFSGFFSPRSDPALDFLKAGGSFSTEAASQLTWGVSVAALLITGLLVIWVAGDALRASHRDVRRVALRWLALIAAVCAGVVWLALENAGFGGSISKALIEGLVCRDRLQLLIPTTDVLNALTGGAVVAAVLTACLMAAPASADKHAAAAAAELARRWRILDRMLYAGAAMLIAGMIEVIALHSWALAPYAGMAEAKAQSDLCGKVAGVDAASPKPCVELKQTVERAPTVDELRKFVRALAITLGAGFSLLLASLYVPAAIVLQLRAPRAHGGFAAATAEPQPAFAAAPGARLFKIAATVAPLATGLLSALVDMKFA